MSKIRMTYVVISILLAGLSLCATVEAQQSQENSSRSKFVIGTFDSRALAMAYYRSDAFERQLEELTTEYEKAKAAGDQERVKELEGKGPAQQELAHKQGFGTWPVDNILKLIEENIPGIAEQANVDVIVSKWNIVYERSGVTFVDITDLMVKPFNPDEATLKTIEEIQKQDPVPIEELGTHEH